MGYEIKFLRATFHAEHHGVLVQGQVFALHNPPSPAGGKTVAADGDWGQTGGGHTQPSGWFTIVVPADQSAIGRTVKAFTEGWESQPIGVS